MVALTAASAFGPARGALGLPLPRGRRRPHRPVGGRRRAEGLGIAVAAQPRALGGQPGRAVTQGAFLDAGRVAGTVKIAEARGRGEGGPQPHGGERPLRRFAHRGAGGKLTADGPLPDLPFVTQATGTSDGGDWGLNGRGVFSDAKPGYAATFDGQGKLGGRTLRTLETAQVRFGGPEQSARLKLADLGWRPGRCGRAAHRRPAPKCARR